MIISFFGQPGSGKTTHSNLLKDYFNDKGILNFSIDGDNLRHLFNNTHYSKEGRYENIRTANKIATYLNNTCNCVVLMSLVNPYSELREELNKYNKEGDVQQIYLQSTRLIRNEYCVDEFEIPSSNSIIINTDSEIEILLKYFLEL